MSKREWINPHRLGDGLKLVEQSNSRGGTLAALQILLACSAGRGGGDVVDREGQDYVYDPHTMEGHYEPTALAALERRFVGRWAGDRIAIVGDYAEDDDIPGSAFPASLLYDLCRDEDDLRYDCHDAENCKRGDEQHWKCEYVQKNGFTDISDQLVPLVEKMCDVKIIGTGWRERLEIHHIQSDTDPTKWYEVTAVSCTCLHFTNRRTECKHIKREFPDEASRRRAARATTAMAPDMVVSR